MAAIPPSFLPLHNFATRVTLKKWRLKWDFKVPDDHTEKYE